MKKYFSKIVMDHWTAKNELHRSILKIAEGFDCKLFEASQLQMFIDDLKHGIEEANCTYKKCKPFLIEIEGRLGNEISIYINGVFHMCIYEANPYAHKL